MKKSFFPFLIFHLSFFISYSQQPWIFAGNDTSICAGSPVTLNATVQNLNQTSSYTISTVPYAPDSYTNGTFVTLNDDQYSQVINIGFTFCFYGNAYTQLLISSNNYLTFILTNAGGYSPWPITAPIPTPANPMNAIMGPWQDINPGVGGSIRYAVYGTAPFRRFTVSYLNVPMFSCTNQLYTSQIMLYETTNIIETHIQNKPLCTTWNSGAAIHGLHNSTGTLATVVTGRNYPSQWTTTNEGTRFTPSGPPYPFTVSWFELPGMNNAGAGQNILVTPTATTSYLAQVSFTACTNPVFTDTVTINVVPLPAAGINYAPSNPVTNEPVTFTDISNANGDSIVMWFWDFGTSTYTGQNPPPQVWTVPGTYCVRLVVTNTIGCRDTLNECLVIIPDDVSAPNVFSPNGDGYNDFFVIENAEFNPDLEVQIFNRWGTLLYKNSNYERCDPATGLNCWSPEGIHDGTYYYIVSTADGKVKKGFVTIIR